MKGYRTAFVDGCHFLDLTPSFLTYLFILLQPTPFACALFPPSFFLYSLLLNFKIHIVDYSLVVLENGVLEELFPSSGFLRLLTFLCGFENKQHIVFLNSRMSQARIGATVSRLAARHCPRLRASIVRQAPALLLARAASTHRPPCSYPTPFHHSRRQSYTTRAYTAA
jgi:hypothetical protein